MADEPQNEPEPQPDPEPAPDPTERDSVERDGKKWVPLSALKEERTKRQGLEASQRDLATKAERAEKLEQFAAQVQPLLDALKGKPDLVKQILSGESPPPPSGNHAPNPEDEMMAEIAQKFDLYDASGRPDPKRLSPLMTYINQKIQQGIEQGVAPVAKGRLEDRALANYQWMLQQTDGAGNRVDKTIIDNIVSRVPREDLANAEMAPNLWLMAYGAQNATKAKKTVPPEGTEPVFVESAGGPAKLTGLTESQKRIAKEFGRSESDVLKDLQKAVDNDGVVE